MLSWITAGLLALLVLAPSEAIQQHSQLTAIKDVRIFDGENVIPRGTVVFGRGRILDVGRDVVIPSGAEVIDGADQTVLPGLIDAHVHVLYAQVLRQFAVFGITSVVDMHMDVAVMQEIKSRQVEADPTNMASLVSAGTLVTVPGGHGTEYGLSIPTITSPEEAQSFVDARIAEGSDFIKIIYDDGRALSNELPTLDQATLRAVIEAAHRRGKLAVVHIMSLREAGEAIEAGADGLAHLFCEDAYDEEFGRLAARHDVFVIPTLTVLQIISGTFDPEAIVDDSLLSPYLRPSDVDQLRVPFPKTTGRAGYEAAVRAVRQLKAAGVLLLAGTDAVIGVSLHHELGSLVEAGLSPVEALIAATSAPATAFDLADRGGLRPGLRADLVLVRGDPTEDIRATRDIVGVWKHGVRVEREAYRRSVEEHVAAVERQRHAPPPEGSESGLISDFEGGEISASFGFGWSISTDALISGKSTAEFEWTEGGARGSTGSMLISGTVPEGGPFAWAGAMFYPGPRPMSPANLSAKRGISFWAKGDGKRYSVMMFAQSLGYRPAIQYFVAEQEWTQYTFRFEQFGIDGHDLTGVFVGGGPEQGGFVLQIDDVKLE